MNIEVKNSKKPIEYVKAIKFLEERIDNILNKEGRELIWILEHPSVYTAGTNYKENEILDKTINVYKTNRGGKITYHGPGQLICYFVLDLNKRNRDIRKFLNIIENTIIETLKEYKIISSSDNKNIGIWIKQNKKIKKIGAIGIRVKKWIAYHGFSINIRTDLRKYKKIIPCGINNKDLINLCSIRNVDYNRLGEKLTKNFINNLKN
jgi:lipoyl(octanoyl) transferase